jgi:TRAP-type C4-dicarboxylate transport system permease small subunit
VNLEPEEAPELRERGPFFKLVGRVSRWSAYLGGVTLIAITAIVTYDVFARFLGHPTDWATEVAGYMVIGVAVLGAAETLRHNEHFAMHLVVDLLQPRTRIRVGLAVWCLVTALIAGLCWGLLALVDNSLQYGLRSSTIVGAPLAVPQLVLLAGFFALLLALVARIIALTHRIRRDRQ